MLCARLHYFQEADIFSAIDELRSIGASRYISLPRSSLSETKAVASLRSSSTSPVFPSQRPDSGDTESLEDTFSAEVTLEPADDRIKIPSVGQGKYDVKRPFFDSKPIQKARRGHPTREARCLVENQTSESQLSSVDSRGSPGIRSYNFVPATSDLAGNVVLSIAKVHDPDGNRTMCVVTKPDLIEKGTEDRIINAVQGRQLQLTLGYHLTLNRSNADVTAGLSFSDQERKETEFFSRKAWMDIDRLDKGILGLREKLVNILRDHIRAELPTVKKEIKSQIDKCSSALESLGPKLPTTLEGKMANLMRWCVDISAGWMKSLDGIQSGYVPTVRAKLQELGESFSETMQKRVDDNQGNAWTGATGFMQYRPFEVLASRCVEGWRDEVENYIDSVFAELNKSLIEVVTEKVPELMRRPFEEAYRILSSERRPLIYSKRFAEQFREAKLKTIQEDVMKSVGRSNGSGSNVYVHSDQAISMLTKMEDPSSESAVLEMKRALSVYLKVAAERTVDSIGVHVIEMHVSIDGEAALRNAISAVKADNIVENPGTVRKRKNLEEKKATLLLASGRLKTL
ncbi:Dynamin central region-domain-containing protein [Chytridium lagenaria]|nr:Dynamin central region-domain-containing protein [Chytridium lagenaria]